MDGLDAKPCPRCQTVKPIEAFAPRRKTGRQSWCQACLKVYQRGRPRVLAARRIVREAKKGRSCADCGLHYPHFVMDFDHRPGEGKRAGINVLVKRGTKAETLLDELSRCDLVCANCHRIRTYQRRQNYHEGTELLL